MAKKTRRSLRRGLLLCALCAVAAAGVQSLGFAMARRLVVGALAGSLLGAREAHAVKQADKDRLITGYKDLVYMMQNFNKVTRKCDKNQENVQRALQSGQNSPDSCIAQPLVVRKYLGQTSIKANLFDTKNLLVNLEVRGFGGGLREVQARVRRMGIFLVLGGGQSWWWPRQNRGLLAAVQDPGGEGHEDFGQDHGDPGLVRESLQVSEHVPDGF
ncbi:unnamed protein product [Effrenium voratum]|nr:unnamed protein product [Effrenium voratum]